MTKMGSYSTISSTNTIRRPKNIDFSLRPFVINNQSFPFIHDGTNYQNQHYFNYHRYDFSTMVSTYTATTALAIGIIPKRSFSSSTILYYNRMAMTTMGKNRQQLAQCLPMRKSSSNSNSNKNTSENEVLSSSSSSTATTNTNTTSNNKIQEFMVSTVSTVRPIVGSAEASIKRAVEELSTGDLLSVYGIVFLIILIAVAPSMIRRMQRSDAMYGEIDHEDPVMDLARMIRGEYWGDDENDDEENGNDTKQSGTSSPMGLDRIVVDLLKSPQIQEAAITLVTKVIESSQFKISCQVLLKELLQDLLADPDTLKQVIYLLQNAIVNEKIQEAAVQLAMDIFGDDRVLDELVTLVQRLGMEKQVQQATQALLVESAHNTLNDPEILDHSMEFATDVVGDDVVQQTAGEALYNTMSYAFRPTLSVVLTLLGVGLIFVSTAAFRNVNQSPSAATDRAFVKTIESYTSRMLKILVLSLDFVTACKDAIFGIFFFPFRILSSSLLWVGKVRESIIESIQKWFLWLLHVPARFLTSIQRGSRTSLEMTYIYLICQLSKLKYVASTSFIGVLFQTTTKHVSSATSRTKIRWIILNHRVSDYILHLERLGKQTITAIQTAIHSVFLKL